MIMKTGSDNFRDSSVLSIMEHLHESGCEVLIYEPMLKETQFGLFSVCSSLDEFIESCDLIVANRFDTELAGVREKVFSRDLFQVN